VEHSQNYTEQHRKNYTSYNCIFYRFTKIGFKANDSHQSVRSITQNKQNVAPTSAKLLYDSYNNNT